MTPVEISDDALADIDVILEYLSSSDANSARRFLDRMELVVDILAGDPGCGMHLRVERPDLEGVRWKHVPGFRQYLVFYRWDDLGVKVLRVFHSSQDWMDKLLP